jgi:hypothetical protein
MDPIWYLHRVLCMNRSLDLGRTRAIAWQAGVSRRALKLSNDSEECRPNQGLSSMKQEYGSSFEIGIEGATRKPV